MSSDSYDVDAPRPPQIEVVARGAGLDDPARLHWTIERIDHASIIDTTGGLYRVLGYEDESADTAIWSCVVKVLRRSDDGESDAPQSWCYWRREAEFYRSDLPGTVHPSLRTPRLYAVTEGPSTCSVWMEHVSETQVAPWSIDDYHRVAVAAGEAAGNQLAHHVPLTEPWLVPGFMRSVLADGGLWDGLLSPDAPDSAWMVPLVQDSLDRVDSDRFDNLWQRRHDVLAILDQLPSVLCHNDLHRRNVLLQANGASACVVDWAFAGPGALATDAAHLTAGTLFLCDFPISAVQELDAAVFAGYLEGLTRRGWTGDERLVRLGFCASIALGQGLTLPGWLGFMLPEDEGVDVERLFGSSAGAVRDAWVQLFRYSHERADEAASLSRHLGLSRSS